MALLTIWCNVEFLVQHLLYTNRSTAVLPVLLCSLKECVHTFVLPVAAPPLLLVCQHIGVVEEQLRASKEEMERCLSEYDELFRTIQRLSEELKMQIAANTLVQARTTALVGGGGVLKFLRFDN